MIDQHEDQLIIIAVRSMYGSLLIENAFDMFAPSIRECYAIHVAACVRTGVEC